ncbi:MAG TPA: hypothetical protein VJ550_02440 [Geomonas sp.]|nr:hypothetical protein [Geomonas sp.]
MTKLARLMAAAIFFIVSALAAAKAHAISDCVYGGINFSDGAIACQSGNQFQCSDGDWQSLDNSCATPPPPPAVVNPAACSCTDAETADCDQKGENCCVSLEAGSCKKLCCPR